MKKLFRTLVCGAALALTLITASLAAEPDLLISPAPGPALPERQGDFYVMVNGEFITFPDAVPQARDNRSFLPMATVFSQLGFAQEDMTWTPEGVITATKRNVLYTPSSGGEQQLGDMTVTMVMGEKNISIQYSGDTIAAPTTGATQVVRDYPCDVAPYVDPATWRTYIPFGLVADALGYQVGWDGVTGTVIIDDVDAILAENTETYELMDKCLDYSRSLNGNRNTLTTGQYDVAVSSTEIDETGSSYTVTGYFGGPYEMLTNKDRSAYEFTWDATLDMLFYRNDQDISEIMKALMLLGGMELPMTIDMTMLCNLEDNISYSTPVGGYISGDDPAPGGTWQVSQTTPDSPTDPYYVASYLSDLGVGSENFNQSLRSLLQSLELTSCTYTCRDYLAELNALYADSAFEKTGSTYTSGYESVHSGSVMELSLYTTPLGKVDGYSLSVGQFTDQAMLDIVISTEGKEMLAIIDQYTSPSQTALSSISLVMTGTYQSTAQNPKTEPPEGAVIIPADGSSMDSILGLPASGDPTV